MAPICCSRSVAQSTTAHSVPGLGIDLTGSLMRTRPLPMRHDPPDPWTVPPAGETINRPGTWLWGLLDGPTNAGGYEAMAMVRKGQVRNISGGDIRAQAE